MSGQPRSRARPKHGAARRVIVRRETAAAQKRNPAYWLATPKVSYLRRPLWPGQNVSGEDRILMIRCYPLRAPSQRSSSASVIALSYVYASSSSDESSDSSSASATHVTNGPAFARNAASTSPTTPSVGASSAAQAATDSSVSTSLS